MNFTSLILKPSDSIPIRVDRYGTIGDIKKQIRQKLRSTFSTAPSNHVSKVPEEFRLSLDNEILPDTADEDFVFQNINEQSNFQLQFPEALNVKIRHVEEAKEKH